MAMSGFMGQPAPKAKKFELDGMIHTGLSCRVMLILPHLGRTLLQKISTQRFLYYKGSAAHFYNHICFLNC